MYEDKFVDKEEVAAGCGMVVKKSEGFVCPYFCRREEWEKHSKGHGPCGVDLQIGTNVCLHAIEWR